MLKKWFDEAHHKWHQAKVIRGQGKGKELGFPTANLEVPESFDFKYGIYAANINEDKKGILYWGTKGGQNPSLEIYIFDFDGDLYGTQIQFQVGEFIREDKHFDSDKALVVQIKNDIKRVKEIYEKARS